MKRRLSKQESRERWAQLRQIVNEWDPIGVMDDPGWPQDEYDCLVGPLMRMLEDHASPKKIVSVLQREIQDHFGLDTKHLEFVPVATRLSEWFQAHWADTIV